MTETTTRTLVKTISWRIIATIASFIISYFIIDDIVLASSIAGIQVIFHTILYYIHERVWIGIDWGK
jgi:uncharacterized membrane protein